MHVICTVVFPGLVFALWCCTIVCC